MANETSAIHVLLPALLCRRAKLFRFDFSSDNPEWKERGVGDVKFMKHKNSQNIRLLMRRDKTHKLCANHFSKRGGRERGGEGEGGRVVVLTPFHSPLSVTPEMKLTPSAGSDRAWVWTVQADFADEEAKAEQLAIRFKNCESEETIICPKPLSIANLCNE